MIFTLPGCSSSTDSSGIQTADGLIVTLTSAPFVSVGDTLVVTLTATNPTNGTVTREFVAGDYEPRPMPSNDDLENRDSLESIIGTFLDTHAAHTVTLGPHESISGTFRFTARHAGESTLTVYFPTVVTGFANIRVTRSVVVN
ncbi:MAG: hypothetical protein ABIQ10_16050 [Gemmatimonadaceae bacterium]